MVIEQRSPPAPQSRLDDCLNSFQIALSSAGGNYAKAFEQEDRKKLNTFLGNINTTPAQQSVVHIEALAPILFVFDKIQAINIDNQFLPRSLEPLFGVIKYTLVISQKTIGTAFYAGAYLVRFAETIKQLDDTMFGDVKVAYIYEIFVKMSCEILDFCVAFISKVSTIKRPVNRIEVDVIMKPDMDASLTHLNQHYESYNSLLGRQTMGARDHGQESDSEMELNKKAEEEAKAKSVQFWLDNIISRAINIVHASMQEARKKESKTGAWFVHELESWLSQEDTNIFWATGIPGAGKSILMSTFIDHLETQADRLRLTGYAYFYFLYDSESSQKELKIYAALLRQLYRKHPPLTKKINKLYDDLKKDNLEPVASHLAEILQDLEAAKGLKIVLAFDALDEIPFDRQTALVKFIEGLNPKIFYILVTARNDLTVKIPDRATRFTIQAQSDDMESYIRESLSGSSALLEYAKSKSEKSKMRKINEIVHNLLENASGMFLVTRYQVDHLLECSTVGEMLRTSKILKEGEVDNFHHRSFEQICKQRKERRETALRILSWLVFAKRPLSEDEIAEAVAIRTVEDCVKAIDRPSKTNIIELCRGLVKYDHNEQVIRLAHKTVQDYLIGELKGLQPNIASDCFTYISFTTTYEESSDGSSDDESDSDLSDEYGDHTETAEPITELSDNESSFQSSEEDVEFDDYDIPFNLTAWNSVQGYLTEYVCSYGIDHLKDLPDDMIPIESVMKYLTTVPPNKFQQLMEGENTYPREFTPFHTVMLLGKTEALHSLMKYANASYPIQNLIECEDLKGRTPLMWALRHGNSETIQAVLEYGANILHTDKSNHQALYYAARCTLSPVIRDLIRDSGSIQDTTIAQAVYEGNVPLVRQFLQSGASALVVLENGTTLLHLAVPISPSTTACEMVSLLLRWKTTVNTQDCLGRTALHLCFTYSLPESLMLLTATKPAPNFNLQDNDGNSPIHLAAELLNKSIFQEMGPRSPIQHLTDLDVDVFLTNNQGDTPLHIAASSRNLEMMSNLLARAGVQQRQNPEFNLNAKNGEGKTILELAFDSDYEPVVDLLLQNKAIDVDAYGADGGHALKWATIHGMSKVAKVILKRSLVNLNRADSPGHTALHDAAIFNRLEVAECLLEYHPDIASLNYEHKTALTKAAEMGSFEVLGKLIEEQMRVNIKLNMDWTMDANKDALLCGARSGSLRCVELLMERYDHQLNERSTTDGCTPLHYSVLRRSLHILNFFLSRDGDPNVLTADGKTALDLALEVGDAQIIEALLGHNALSGQPWENSLTTKKWVSKPWYPSLQWQLTTSERWDLVKSNKSRSTWARITRCRTADLIIDEESPDQPYLEVPIPQGGQSPIRRIRFQIRSHDQGWGDEQDSFRGSYFNTYSWFEAGVKRRTQTSTPDESESRRMIQRNQYAIWEFQDHNVVWDYRDQTPGLNDWLQSLQPGDILQIYPKARFRGWQNFVQQVKLDIFYEAAPNTLPSSLSSPRVVIYHQTTHSVHKHVSLLPVLGTGITHVILAAIHLNEKPGQIHLNDHPPDNPHFDTLWSEVLKLQASGIKVHAMLGGAAPGTFSPLDKDAATFDAYYLPLKAMIAAYNLQGLDLDVEEEMSQEGITRLIDRLRSDFGPDFLITLAPLAAALLQPGEKNLSGFDYFTLESERGHEIAWYNTQFYNGCDALKNEDEYNNILCLGWDPSKVVAGVLTHPTNGAESSYTDMDTLQGTLHILKEQHRDFGGVMGWEYFNAHVEGQKDANPEEWARTMSRLMRQPPELDGADMVRRLALRWRDKARSRQAPENVAKDLSSIVLLQMRKKGLGGLKHFPSKFSQKVI